MEQSKKEINFEFPFEPYDIQKSFMNSLYETLQNEKIGIFESPTGTGKSLSLICGSLRWLLDHEAEKEEKIKSLIQLSSDVARTNDNEENAEESKEPSWVTDFFKQKAANVQLERLKAKEALKKKKNELIEIRKNKINFKRKREDCPSLGIELNNNLTTGKDEKNINDESNIEDDEELILDYTSDKDTADATSDEEQDDIEEEHFTKIFYCSRTHSQLSQFVHEVQKSPYANRIKLVVLGSRQNYCINEKVNKYKNVYQINEKCLDLQKKKKERKKEKNQPKKKHKKEETSCPFYSSKTVHDFSDHVTMEVQDIEQVVKLGKDLNTCPYYGTRHSIPKAQLVVLPYQTLLHRGTRESVGINLKDCIVIIDEAHNLIETINNIHSIEIQQNQITSSINQLKSYKDKYFKRLKAINLMYIEQIIFVLNSLLKVLKGSIESPTEEYLSTINDFVYSAKIDNVNLFKIHKYCEQSSIAKKLNGFVEKYQTEYITTHTEEEVQTSQFMHAESFLYALTNSDKDGRILVTKSKASNKSSIKFLMLNPAVHFNDIIKDCKSLILAGGTMAPVSEIKDLLFYTTGILSSQITEFSCGHVIPSSNLLVLTLQKGPSSIDMNFTYQNRNSFDLIDELGRLLVNVCSVVPGGIVCFFPSYDYEEFVYQRWANTSLFNKVDSKKKVFREPKSAMLCDQVLSEYTNMIKKSHSGGGGGAVLLSVVGGKMSEGINFSDELGRCIIMIGLPYPNVNSPELKEKMQFLNRTISPTAGKEHFENICMKAVNQSIGRSIRHKNDYASILLIDERYSRHSVIKKLPCWIKSQLQTHQRFGPALASISKFFAGKRVAL